MNYNPPQEPDGWYVLSTCGTERAYKQMKGNTANVCALVTGYGDRLSATFMISIPC